MRTNDSFKKSTANQIFRKLTFAGICLAIFSFTLTSCEDEDDDTNLNTGGEIVYVETNDFNSNQNAILAYRNNGDGKLASIPGSPFPTGGAGVGNPQQILGPNDSDTQVIISQDKKYLLAVNSGSNTIAVFTINPDGSLQAVPGSPFPSGGQTPVSLAMSGNYVFVVNKSQDPTHTVDQAPNYTTLMMAANGALTMVTGAKVEVATGSSPTQILLSNDKKYAFGADFLAFQLTPPQGTLRSFTVNNAGMLTPVPGTPQAIPGMGGALGLWQHPSANILYVGFPLQAKVGIYSIENSGALTFQSTVDAGPAACWIRTADNGNYMYSMNSGENSISVYNTSNPASPASLQKIMLKNSGPTYMAMGMPFVTSEGFSLEFSPSEKFFYVVSQHTNPDFSIGNFNYLHVLHKGNDGRLSEPNEPLQLPVPATLRPQGTAILELE